MDQGLLKFTKYVYAAADLADAVQADIENGAEISSATVLALSKFVTAQIGIAEFVNEIESLGDGQKIQ